MKKTLLALAVLAACGTAFASGSYKDNDNDKPSSSTSSATGGNAAAGAAAGAVAGAAAGAVAGAAGIVAPVTTVAPITAVTPVTTVAPITTTTVAPVTSIGSASLGGKSFSPEASVGNVAGGSVSGSGNSTNDNKSTATVGNVGGGSATAGSVGNVSGLGNTVKSLSPEATANSTNLNTALGGSAQQGQLQGQQQGQGQAIVGSGNSAQGQAILGSGNSKNIVGVSTKGTVGNVSTGEQANAQSTNVGGQSVSIVSGDNQYTVDAARALAEGGNRGAEDAAATIAAATLAANATTEAAKLQADAIRYASTQKIKNTPSVDGPALTSSNDTCMGSTSGSVNAPGIGVGFGTSWVDNNCKMLKNSRELWNMGMRAAALALMCKDADNKAALEETGFVCPATAAATKKAEAEAADAAKRTAQAESTKVAQTGKAEKLATAYTGNDPIVKARLGLQ